MKRISFTLGKTLQVFRLGTSTNEKICTPKEKILQSYTYSEAQFNYIKDSVINNTKRSFKDFFALDSENCFDCPFSSNSGNSNCYTHKFRQYSGFLVQLKSIVNEFGSFENIPTYNSLIGSDIAKLAIDRYVRFGSYGEPSMHPLELVKVVAENAKLWSGYTHQYVSKPEYSKWFMASTHNELQAKSAKDKFGFRSFLAVADNKGIKAVICPASNESTLDTSCSACGLCSGSQGKGTKNVVIIEH